MEQKRQQTPEEILNLFVEAVEADWNGRKWYEKIPWIFIGACIALLAMGAVLGYVIAKH